MVLPIVKAAALQFLRTVLAIVMAGLGPTVVLAIFLMIAVPVVPFAVFMIPVVPMLAVTSCLFPLRAALLTDHTFLLLAHFFLLVTIVGTVHFFALLKLALLPHLFALIVPIGHESLLGFGRVRWSGKIRRIWKKRAGCGGMGVA